MVMVYRDEKGSLLTSNEVDSNFRQLVQADSETNQALTTLSDRVETLEDAPGYSLPIASTTELGGVKVGNGLAIDVNGVLYATGGSGPGGSVSSVAGVLPDGNGDIPLVSLKATFQLGAVATSNSYNDLDDKPTIPTTAAQVGAIPLTQKAQPNGVATLNGSGVIPSEQLPGYVDDVLEFPALSNFPLTGETGKIYVALDTNRQYRWPIAGSAYVELVSSPGTTSNVPEGSNLYFTTARVLATVLSGLSVATGGDVVNTDTVLQAFGKLQNRIAAMAITLATKLTNPLTTAGDMIYSSAGTTAARLAKGTDGQVLTMVSGFPAWANSSGGGSVVFRAVKTFTATNNQTSFNIPDGFTPGQTSVTVDGVDWYDFSDATSPDVVFTNGQTAKTGQTVQVTYFSTFSVANALPAGAQAVDSAKLGGELPSAYLKAADFQQFMTITERVANTVNQTVFAASRVVAGPILVAINGALTRDFTVSVGSANVTLLTGVQPTDEVTIYEFQGFAVANALPANGVASDSNKLNGQLAAFYAGVSDLNALAATVAGLPFTKYYEVTIAWANGGIYTVTHNLGVIPKFIYFEGVVKVAFSALLVGDTFQSVIGGYGGTGIYGQEAVRLTTTNFVLWIANTGLATINAGGGAVGVTPAQADLKIKVFA